jgi:type IV pilus assembly protein PilC
MIQLAFQYKAVDRRGVASKGVVRAADRHEAYRQLAATGLRPMKIAPVRGGRRAGGRVTTKDLAHFTYQFSVLTQARIPIVDGLEAIAAQETNARLRSVIEDIARNIAQGNTFTDSIMSHRELFGDVYVETIRAAEVSGNMVEVLQQLSDMLERQYEINKDVKSALMYPICVVAALVLAVAFLMVAVVPKFAAMFAARGIDLPLATQIVVAVSGALRGYWYIFLLGGFGALWTIRRGWRHPAWRQRIDGWLHKVPVLREILRGLAISRFAHVFGISLRSGLGLIDAIEMSGNASGRPLLQEDCEKMRQQVNVGGRLSDVLFACSYLPPFTRRMLAAGEEAAEMSRMCEIVARHYDREVTHLTKNITTIIEPIMIAGLAVVVLVIALAIFLPMWNMAALIG